MENKKITAITCVFSNPQYARTTPRGLELIYLKQLLEEKNREVLMFGKKGRTNQHLDFFYDVSNISNFDIKSVIIQLAPANFFGGKYSDYSLDTIAELAILFEKGDIIFNILPTDPRIKPLNPAKIMYERFNLCGNFIDTWERIINESTYLFPGKDISKFYNKDMNVNIYKLDWFAYIFKKGVEFSEYIDDTEKEFDIIYYGDKRGSYRNNRIKTLMPYSTKNLLLGYKEPKITYAKFENKVNHSELFKTLNKCKVSLVIGDKEHEDNVATFRFYEALSSSALAAIDINYDPNKELIKNNRLKELLYVSNMNDVKRLSGLYSKELIYLQQQELKRIFDEIKY